MDDLASPTRRRAAGDERRGAAMPPGALVVCLLPVRNGEADLPGWFDSVERIADAVVALDDGSTDGTRALLEAHPLVFTVLANPPRPDARGWDDGANRARLLDAARSLSPSWIFQLDVDERIEPDDAATLRDFLLGGGGDAPAYLFRVHRMIEDVEHFDRRDLWVGRLFRYVDRQRLPTDRLHLVPLPTSISENEWCRTTVRIQHLASLTPERRTHRFRKYTEADPDRVHQANYTRLLEEPGTVEEWSARPPALPVVLNGPWHGEAEAAAAEREGDPSVPAVSAVVIARNDEARIERVVASVVGQEVPEPIEVIVVTTGTDGTAEVVHRLFPTVQVVELQGRAYPGRARNAGLALARGRYVSFPGSHVELPPGSLAARLRAHRLGYAMVTGTTVNGTPTASGWASYFLDHNSVLPGRPSEALRESPAHCSYLREALRWAGGFPEDVRSGEDTFVNNALFRQGYGAWRAQDVELVHNTPCRTPTRLLRHHFTRGRGFGRLLLAQQQPGRRLLTRRMLRATLVLYVPGRVRRVGRAVQAWGDADLRRRWRQVLPLVLAATTSSWLGAWFELLRPQRRKLAVLIGRRSQ